MILWRDFADSSAVTNGYVPPKFGYSHSEEVRKSMVTIECKGEVASGFIFAFEDADDAEFAFTYLDPEKSSIVLTNYHVIKNCFPDDSELTAIDNEGERLQARIMKVDIENDLAALRVPKNIVALLSAYYVYRPGYWVMAIGSPYGMFGTTTFGNITYIEGNRIYTSASLNKGNSGGPLVDNLGYVMAINTGYKAVAQNLNFAIDINLLCKEIAKCYGKTGLLHAEKDE
jgi:S1-C subfamily serine protease